ncbi:MAG: NADH-quinone oxidoreductase subunit C [Deltaproteobacteria bacterium]|nr:NADH-quinone oxidoreductase subunit C [Deltaproteobacteria bacterium]
MNTQAIFERLDQILGDQVKLDWQTEHAGDPFALVNPEHWHTACQVLRDDEALTFDFLRSLTAVDRPEQGQLELVVHLFAYKHRQAFVLKTLCPREEGQIQTVSDIWPAANWHEREVFDLFGLDFEGHPDMRRLLMPDDWVGHPLLKDYQEEESYRGIPTRRPGYPIAGSKK